MTRTKTLLALALALFASTALAGTPKVGDQAKDFTLLTIANEPVKLSEMTEKGPVVLVVLRGYPGYQCPLCTRQVGEFIGKKKELEEAGAKVLFVYPGPQQDLQQRAMEFKKGADGPREFQFLLDPNYKFTTAYGLRWDAPKETAYPATFVISKGGKVEYAKVSDNHAGRASVKDVLAALGAKQ